MDIPYPSLHTMSSNHRVASEMPLKCFRCCIAKKEGGGRGFGVVAQLESPVETHSIFVVFCACVVVVVFVWFGGG